MCVCVCVSDQFQRQGGQLLGGVHGEAGLQLETLLLRLQLRPQGQVGVHRLRGGLGEHQPPCRAAARLPSGRERVTTQPHRQHGVVLTIPSTSFEKLNV